MTQRERLLAALDRREPDRVPVDLGATATSTITREAYLRLRTHLGLAEAEPEILSFTAQSVRPHADLLEALRIDTRGVKPRGSSTFQAKVTIEGDYEIFFDEAGIGSRRPRDGGLYFDLFHHPLNGESAAAVAAWPLPRGDDPARAHGLREQCEALRRSGFPVVLSQSIGRGILHEGTALFGFEDYFTRLYDEPQLIAAVSERILENKIAFYDTVLGEAGEFIDVITEADDLGTQRGPFIAPDMYRKMFKPLQARLFSEIRRRAPHVKVFFHSCGSLREFIPDLIDIGVDALNPVQVSAHGMDPETLKREYGRDICFWGGGVDTQEVLPTGSPDRVRDEVRRRLDVWLPGGGYVFAAVHNIQADVPPENVEAMFTALDEYR